MKFKRNKLAAALILGGSMLCTNLSVLAADTRSTKYVANKLNQKNNITQLAKVNLNDTKLLLDIATKIHESNVSQDYHDQVIALLDRAAAAGSAEANFQLGMMYSDCSYMGEDEDKAEQLFKRAADMGHTGAKFVYAHWLDSGFGVGC